MSLRRRSCWNRRLGRGRTSLEDAPIRTRSRLSTSAASSTLRLASTHGSIFIWTSIWSRAESHLPTVIAETVRRRYQGRVSVGHVTKLSATPPEELDALTVGLSEAGVAVTALPATDLYLNGREYRHLIPRGVAPIHRLAAQGVVATIATNNVMNPFTPFGDASLMRMANLYANVAQIGSPAELGRVFGMITDMALKLMGKEHVGVKVGAPADIVIFDASSGADGVATIAPAIAGWKNGRRTFFRPPPQLFSRTDSSVDSSLVPASSFWPRRGEGA